MVMKEKNQKMSQVQVGTRGKKKEGDVGQKRGFRGRELKRPEEAWNFEREGKKRGKGQRDQLPRNMYALRTKKILECPQKKKRQKKEVEKRRVRKKGKKQSKQTEGQLQNAKKEIPLLPLPAQPVEVQAINLPHVTARAEEESKVKEQTSPFQSLPFEQPRPLLDLNGQSMPSSKTLPKYVLIPFGQTLKTATKVLTVTPNQALNKPAWENTQSFQSDLSKGHSESCSVPNEATQQVKPRTVNLAKISTILQMDCEHPVSFYKRLKEAYVNHTPIEEGNPLCDWMVKQSFVIQSTEDIRNKIQRLQGFLKIPTKQLVNFAQKVYILKRLKDKIQKQKGIVTAQNEEKGPMAKKGEKTKRKLRLGWTHEEKKGRE